MSGGIYPGDHNRGFISGGLVSGNIYPGGIFKKNKKS